MYHQIAGAEGSHPLDPLPGEEGWNHVLDRDRPASRIRIFSRFNDPDVGEPTTVEVTIRESFSFEVVSVSSVEHPVELDGHVDNVDFVEDLQSIVQRVDRQLSIPASSYVLGNGALAWEPSVLLTDRRCRRSAGDGRRNQSINKSVTALPVRWTRPHSVRRPPQRLVCSNPRGPHGLSPTVEQRVSAARHAREQAQCAGGDLNSGRRSGRAALRAVPGLRLPCSNPRGPSSRLTSARAATRRSRIVSREMRWRGFEPRLQPWQGRVIPLHYQRPALKRTPPTPEKHSACTHRAPCPQFTRNRQPARRNRPIQSASLLRGTP